MKENLVNNFTYKNKNIEEAAEQFIVQADLVSRKQIVFQILQEIQNIIGYISNQIQPLEATYQINCFGLRNSVSNLQRELQGIANQEMELERLNKLKKKEELENQINILNHAQPRDMNHKNQILNKRQKLLNEIVMLDYE